MSGFGKRCCIFVDLQIKPIFFFLESKKSKPSSKNPNISEKEMERRRGRAKHRSIPGSSFFKKRSKTSEGKSDRSKSRSSSKHKNGNESPERESLQPMKYAGAV